MSKFIFRSRLCLSLMLLMCLLPGVRRTQADDKAAKQRERQRWENLVTFYGDEETGGWSLRIRDKDVHARAWFEYLDLWHFNITDMKWEPVKVDKFSKPIVMPKDKGSDQPQDSQTLVDFSEIEPQTAGLWYAKWKVDGTEGGTLMRVGTGRSKEPMPEGQPPQGMIRLTVPLTLEKCKWMTIPDPRLYCITGGPGKPEPSGAKTPEKKEKPAQ